MTADRWTRIDSIVQAALVRPADARDSFVAEACGDDETLAEEVRSLLNQATATGSFLETGAGARAALEQGQTLGAYTIRELLGAGGMGEVYRAHDPRLHRDVALKILPPEVARDPERLRRFQTEARAAAAITHPNIVTIHSVEQAGEMHFLTMELVDGTPLSESIPRDGFDVGQLLEIVTPLADAVAAAHARGIVHRDLKPANVMVGGDGRIKVLDFGLAKLKPLGGLGGAMSNVAPATIEGHLLGTVAYMSPEQAEGREVDSRSDIFSLGVMLYELATGKRPFKGDTSLSLLSSILKDSPPQLTDVKARIPRELSRIVRRCLAKEPGRRYQSAMDLRNDLEDLAKDPESSARGAATLQDKRLPLVFRTGLIGAAAVLAAALLGVAVMNRVPRDLAYSEPATFDIALPEELPDTAHLAISPDSSRVAFASGGKLWVHDIRTNVTRAVPNAGNALGAPFWSPDGRYIAYFQRGRLRRIPEGDGIPEEICNIGSEPGTARGGSWSADGTIIFAVAWRGVYRVPASGGTPSPVTTPDRNSGQVGHMWPHFIDSKRFTYYATGGKTAGVYVGSLDATESPKRVLDDESHAFIESGFIFSVLNRTLSARRVDPRSWNLTGKGTPVARDVVQFSGITASTAFAVSTGALAFRAQKPSRFQFSLVDHQGRTVRLIGDPVLLGGFGWALSPNGQSIALSVFDRETYANRIWLLDVHRGDLHPLSADLGDDGGPVWSPNSEELVFTRRSYPTKPYRGQDLHLTRIQGREREIVVGDANDADKIAEAWHRDGTLLFRVQLAQTDRHPYWLLKPGDGKKPELWLGPQGDYGPAEFSPDGKWVAFVSFEPGNDQAARPWSPQDVYVRRFPEGDRQVRISPTGRGSWPRWRPDGKAVYFRDADTVMEVPLDIGATIRPGVPRKVFDLRGSAFYAVLPDGKGFVVARPVEPPPRPTITVILNWKKQIQ